MKVYLVVKEILDLSRMPCEYGAVNCYEQTPLFSLKHRRTAGSFFAGIDVKRET